MRWIDVVADLRPLQAQLGVAEVVAHRRGARREDREVDPALALHPDLVRLEPGADLIVRDCGGPCRVGHGVPALERLDLLGPEVSEDVLGPLV